MARSTSSKVAVPGDLGRRGTGAVDSPLNLLISLRPGQWTKNLLVFAGLLFGLKLFDLACGCRAPAAPSSSSARCRALST